MQAAHPHWFIRYKLYHLPFWLLYHYIWWVVAIGNPFKAADAILHSTYIIKFSFYIVFQALAVYFNLYFLIPRYLEKGRFTAYLSYLLLTVICATALIIPGYYLTAFAAGKTVGEYYSTDGNCIYQFIGAALPSTLASMTLGMSIKLARNWLQTQRRQQLLEKEKLETELNFLKYQFNPHFLFNSINSIFFLIHKNPHMASASLAKFSDLLRYQLYECNDKQIPLSNEIAYLENFIELEKLRQNDNLQVTFNIQQQSTDHLMIAPFILMTFVENAFKHVSKHADTPNWINMQMRMEEQQLDFIVTNSTSDNASKDVVHYGGIGLKNVQRRLDLLYPGQYQLEIQSSDTRFSVHFHLDVSTQQQTQPVPALAFNYK